MKWNNRRAGRLSTFSRFIIQFLSLKFFLFHISRSVLLVGLTRILRTFVSVSVVFVFARMIWRSPILANGPQLCNGSMLGAHSIYTHWHTRLNHTSYLIHYNNNKKTVCSTPRWSSQASTEIFTIWGHDAEIYVLSQRQSLPCAHTLFDLKSVEGVFFLLFIFLILILHII